MIVIVDLEFPLARIRETIESRRLDRRSVLKLVEKRARTSGILKRVCCHSFRATGVTEYMNSGGTIEIAQRIAGPYKSRDDKDL
jgi:integrase/recombinase XerD